MAIVDNEGPAAVLLQACTNIKNDLDDQLTGADDRNRTPILGFTGGSRVLQRGLATRAELLVAMLAFGVTSAAIVMVAVFAIFLTLRTLDIKQMGFGLAAAILIDSTVIRAVLLPAVMKLLGEWNWYLPRWLEWLPDFTHERTAAPEAAPVPVD